MCLLIIVILSLCKVEFSEGIIGGTDAESGEFPFIVSLRNETNKHYCGGSLITRRHVLTAAHCLFTDQSVFDYEIVEMYEASVIKAVVNTISIADFGGDFYQASKLSPHPAYNVTDISILHDIGVIELKSEIINENVTLISLPSQPVAYEEMATVIGWGINNRDNIKDLSKMSQVLQKADMKVMRPENCIDIYLDKILEYAFVTEAVFINKSLCSAQDHVNVCYRDSGSPLIQGGNLTGIVVFGNECKEGSPDIFTSVFEYLEFILDCIEDRCTAITDVRQLFELKDLL